MGKLAWLALNTIFIAYMLPVYAYASLVTDQYQTAVSGTNNVNSLHRFAQTITVGEAGKFAGVDLYAYGLGVDPDLTVTLLLLDANGYPDDSQKLAAVTLTGTQLTQAEIGPNQPEDRFFDFSDRDLFVDVGDQLAIVISSTDEPWDTGDVSVVYWGPFPSQDDYYLGGKEYRTWNTTTTEFCGWCSNLDSDIYFRTYIDKGVNVPITSTVWLILGGLSLMLRAPGNKWRIPMLLVRH